MVTVVGGGLAGLVCAVEMAEQGLPVDVFERSSTLGGRARTTGERYRVNFGPHAVYADGALWSWLGERGLRPPTRSSNPLKVRFILGGTARRGLPSPVRRAMRLTLSDAPEDRSYRDWASGRVPEPELDATCRLACFYSFASDPGALSAKFVNDRNRRLVRPPSPARFVSDGGWQAIVDAVQRRACELGVRMHTGHRIDDLPDGPVVVATELPAASKLLGEELSAPTVDAVLVDLAVAGAGRRAPQAVMDLDGGAFIERYTAFDPKLAPLDHDLLQCHAGRSPGETTDEAVARIELALDLAMPGWRQREEWRAVRRSDGRTGAVETPTSPWRSRPSIERGYGRYLIGDAVRAPGLLSEVSVTSASNAARQIARELGTVSS